MRIVVAHSHLNTWGGGERSVLELLCRLSQRHEVTLWAGGYVSSQTYEDFHQFPRHEVSGLGWLTQTPHADAVVAHSFGAYLLALRHPNVVCYLHTLRSIYLQGGRQPALAIRRRLDAAALRRSSALLTNSEFTAARARQMYRRRIEVVPPGADDALFRLPAQAGDYALYVGRLAPEKGVERLIRWSAALPLDLVLVGTGSPDYVAHLHSIAGPRTQFRGPLAGEALWAAYAGCRFLAFLAFEEEFGLAALEAMAAAKPIIAVPEGGLKELVAPGQTGMLVSDATAFEAATLRLVASPLLCLQLGRAARTRARAYTWDRYVRRIEESCLSRLEPDNPQIKH